MTFACPVYLIEGNPGSGKTTRMAADMKALPSLEGVLGTTFTRRGRAEGNRALGYDEEKGPFRTLHSIAWKCLQHQQQVRLASTREMAEIYASAGLDVLPNSYVDPYDIQQLGGAVTNCIPLRLKSLMVSTGLDAKTVADRFRLFDGRLSARTALALESVADYEAAKGPEVVDHDDIIARAVIDHEFRYVFVDEAQDLTRAQWDMVVQLSKTAEAVYIYRDVNQAIYSWAGAEPLYLDTLLEGCDVTRIFADHSFRCGAAVTGVAQKFLPMLPQTRPWTAAEGRAGSVRVMRSRNEQNVFGFVRDAIAAERSVLILAMTNSRVRAMSAMLRKAGIPIAGMSEPWADAVQAYLRLERGGWVDVAELRILQKYSTRAADIDPYSRQSWDWGMIFGDVRSNWSIMLDKLTAEQRKTVMWRLKMWGRPVVVPGVAISTVHASKGAEADAVVFDVSVGKKRFAELRNSWGRRVDPYSEVGELVRALYVGVTRARSDLLLLQNDVNGAGTLLGLGGAI